MIEGLLAIRDEKEPQIIVNRARPIDDYVDGLAEEEPAQKTGTLYLRLPTQEDSRYRKVRAMVNMCPGTEKVVVYFADTKQCRGAQCSLDKRLLSELQNVLGQENVVVK